MEINTISGGSNELHGFLLCEGVYVCACVPGQCMSELYAHLCEPLYTIVLIEFICVILDIRNLTSSQICINVSFYSRRQHLQPLPAKIAWHSQNVHVHADNVRCDRVIGEGHLKLVKIMRIIRARKNHFKCEHRNQQNDKMWEKRKRKKERQREANHLN